MPAVDHGHDALPLQLRVLTWRGSGWSAFQAHLNSVVTDAMTAAYNSSSRLTTNRYRQAHRAFTLFLRSNGTSVMVRQYCDLLSKRHNLWADCLDSTCAQGKLEFNHHNSIVLAARQRVMKFGNILGFLCVFNVSFVTTCGVLVFASGKQRDQLCRVCTWNFQTK